eukprot:gene11299-23642_t
MHWCKETIEGAQKSVGPPPTAPPPAPPAISPQSTLPTPSAPPPGAAHQYNAEEYAKYYAQYAAQYAATQYAAKCAQYGHPTVTPYDPAVFNQYYHQYYQQYYQSYSQQAATGSVGAGAGSKTSFGQKPSAPPSYASITTLGPAAWQAAAIAKKPNPSRFATGIINPVVTSTATPSTASTTVSTAPPKKGIEAWSPALTQFVTRSFGSCKCEEDRLFMDKALKALISKVSSDGRLQKHDWVKEPTPTLPSSKKETPIEDQQQKPTALSTSRSEQNGSVNIEELSNGKKRKSRWTAVDDNDKEKEKEKESQKYKNIKGNKSIVNNINKNATKLDMITLTQETKKTMNAIAVPIVAAAIPISQLTLSSEELKMRQSRMNRFQSIENETKNNKSVSNTTTTNINNNSIINKKKVKKSKHIYGSSSTSTSSLSSSGIGNGMSDEDMELLRIVGTCTRLEKDYFRLTSAPDPTTVRPENILRRTLSLLKEKWSMEGDQQVSYVYICNQMKSMRQDLTVQHIQNDLTVQVYEFHARCALESGDINEYNQCQTQLKQLYSLKLAPSTASVCEFTAYRILYYVCVQGSTKHQRVTADMNSLLNSLSDEDKSHPAIKNALEIRHAVQLENYHRLFSLYIDIPNLGALIVDMMLDQWRGKALQRMIRAYKPQVSVAFIIHVLAFDSDEDGLEFLKRIGGVVYIDKTETEIDTKNTVIDLSKLVAKDKLLL